MFPLYIILGWFIVGIIVTTYFYYRKDLKMTSSTRGIVVSAENREIRTENLRRDETVIHCQFDVSGRKFEVDGVLRGKLADKFPAGRKVPVRYNPGDPSMAKIAINQ
jgi:hypothetical protein